MNGSGSDVQQRIELEQVGRIEMQIDVPAERTDARQHALELPHVRHAAEMLDEIEAHAAKSLGMQALEVAFAEAVVGIGDAAIRPPLCAIASTMTVLSRPWQLAFTSTARDSPSDRLQLAGIAPAAHPAAYRCDPAAYG